ncbi:MAG TPA: GatB/YqeY domain-containing protein [Puia sp.]|nr:GatB/YqeY domain-containing protein [Puia sp.]
MALEQKVMAELKAAMLAKNEAALRGLRAIKAAIILAKTSEGAGGELKEADETKLLQKLVKQRKDSLAIYQQQQRADLAQKEEEEIAIIEKFLPQQLDEAALKAILTKIIAETGASSPADIGKVMGAATKQLAGQADGKTINAVARELLSR